MKMPREVMLFILGLALACNGCTESNSTSSTGQQPGPTNSASSSSSPVTAPVDYLGAVGKAQQSAIRTIDVASVTQAIQMFHVENGRYPATLQELVDEKFLPRLPDLPRGMKYSYNASNGSVKVVPQ